MYDAISPTTAAFADAAYKTVIVTADNYTFDHLKMIKDFYKNTPGNERLLQSRIKTLHQQVANGTAAVVMKMAPDGSVAGMGAGVFFGDKAIEQSAMLVAPGHKKQGLASDIQEELGAFAGDRVQIMVERIEEDALPGHIAMRAKSGWSVLPASDPLFQALEEYKALNGLSALIDRPAKTAFTRVASGTQLAPVDAYGQSGFIPAAPASTVFDAARP